MNDRGKGRTMREAVVIACVLLAGPADAHDAFEALKNAPGFKVLRDVPTEFRGRWCLYGKSDAKRMSEYFGRPLVEVTYKPPLLDWGGGADATPLAVAHHRRPAGAWPAGSPAAWCRFAREIASR